MQKRIYFGLFFGGLIIAIGTAFLQSSPGYMDAYYYYYGGTRLAEGHGLTEMIIWNYLDNPGGLPHAAFSYWMPFTSFLAALGIKVFSGLLGTYRGAQTIFIIIAACIPPMTAALAWEITKDKSSALFSGVISAFMGYYLPFIAAMDAFGLYMLLGGLFFLVVLKGGRYRYFVLGVIAGVMHLTRADGFLWLGLAGLAALLDVLREEKAKIFQTLFSKTYILRGLVVVGGYLLVLAPWFLRNIFEFGSLLSPGGSKTMWVLDYSEVFSYPADILTFSHWWGAGISEIIATRFDALFVNLQSTFASLGMIFPGVFAVIGVFRYRRNPVVQLGGIYWLLLIFVMTVIFPYAGVRGGFFHSGSGLMVLIWVMVPIGLDVVSDWSVKVFKWEKRKIKPFYTVLLSLYVVLFSLGIFYTKVIGSDPAIVPIWNVTKQFYSSVEESLQDISSDPNEIIVVINPPAYTVINGRPSVGMPDGGIEPLLAVMERYDASYVLIESEHPEELEELYFEPHDIGGLKYQGTIEDAHLFIWGAE